MVLTNICFMYQQGWDGLPRGPAVGSIIGFQPTESCIVLIWWIALFFTPLTLDFISPLVCFQA